MQNHGIPRATGLADKSESAKQKERQQIKEYLELEREVAQKIKARDYSNTTFQLTSRLLARNPEYYTIWNHRRVILLDVIGKQKQPQGDPEYAEADLEAAEKAGLTPAQREISLLIKEDLAFLVPLLRQFPKCYWIWNHRAWLLNEATQHLPVQVTIELWQGELGLISKMLALDSRNFHGWDYRRKTVGELERLTEKSMVTSEFEYTTKMINSNLSNFSAWHNRSQLIPRLLNEQKADQAARKKLLDDEFELITTALYTDPYDQSLWFYHQYLVSTLDPAAPTNQVDYGRSTSITEPVTDEERRHYLEQEIGSVQDMLNGAEDCKYIYQALIQYVSMYRGVDSCKDLVSASQIDSWFAELAKIDPLRVGRWQDMQRQVSALKVI